MCIASLSILYDPAGPLMPQAGLAMANPETTEEQPQDLAVDDNKKVGGEAADSDEDNDVGTPEVSRV